MSNWIDVKPDDISVDREKNEVDICIGHDNCGANYITIALDVLESKVTSDNNASTPLKKCADCKHGEGENPTPYGSHCYACCKDCKPFFEQRT